MMAQQKVVFCKTRFYYIQVYDFKRCKKVKEKVIKIIAGEKLIFLYYIMDATNVMNFFPGKKRDLSDQSKEQSQDDPKKSEERRQQLH